MWKKGQSGNPKGRPKMVIEEIRAAAREYSDEAIARLAHWMKSKDHRASIPAAVALLDRGWGKPHQESTLNIYDKRDASDWARHELVALIDDTKAGGSGAAAPDGCSGEPDIVH